FIPFLVSKNMPIMIYDVFQVYAKQIMIDIGADTSSSSTYYNEFLTQIDLRDSSDGSTPSSQTQETKLEIYQRLINGTVLTTFSSVPTVDDNTYYQELQTLYA